MCTTSATSIFCSAVVAEGEVGDALDPLAGIAEDALGAVDHPFLREWVRLLGQWNWWAPEPLRRLHARLRLQLSKS